jgi:DNA polymerase-1
MVSLKALAGEFTDMGDYKGELVRAVGGDLEGAELFKVAPYALLARYAAKDADATFRLYKLYHTKFFSDSIFRSLMKLMTTAAISVVEMESSGWYVTEDAIAEARGAFEAEEAELLGRLNEIDAVKRYKAAHGGEFNHNSPQQKGVLLVEYAGLPLTRRTAGGDISTEIKNLMPFEAKSKTCQVLIAMSKVRKQLTTYTTKLMANRSDDGRLRTSFNLAQTGTGRLSSSGPNLQNIPSHGKHAPLVKRQFVAPPGFVIVQFDYSQIELRLMAMYSKDSTMVRAYENKEDLHKLTASAAYQIPFADVKKPQRSVAKTINFFLIFGGTPKSLKETLFTKASVVVSLKEAKVFHQRFFEQYPAVLEYHRRVERFVTQNGWIDTKFGNRRHLPDGQSLDPYVQARSFNIAYNHPIQGTAAGVMLEALERIRLYVKDTTCQMIGTVHDSALLYLPKDGLDEHIKNIKYAMEDMHYEWMTLPIPADVEVGPNWADLEEI